MTTNTYTLLHVFLLEGRASPPYCSFAYHIQQLAPTMTHALKQFNPRQEKYPYHLRAFDILASALLATVVPHQIPELQIVCFVAGGKPLQLRGVMHCRHRCDLTRKQLCELIMHHLHIQQYILSSEWLECILT